MMKGEAGKNQLGSSKQIVLSMTLICMCSINGVQCMAVAIIAGFAAAAAEVVVCFFFSFPLYRHCQCV